MTATTDAHQRIEALAAAMLDIVDKMAADPTVLAAMIARAECEAAIVPLLEQIACAEAAAKGSATLLRFERGSGLVLMHTAVIDTLFGRDREPLRWCPHRTPATTELTLIHAALRFAGCAQCATAENLEHAERMATDNSCDVCGAVDEMVSPRTLQLGPALATIFTGACCDELFDYAKPARTTRIMKAPGRNAPCPCESGRKFKHCHGSRDVEFTTW